MELVLIRGVPGSGKTTMARTMAGYAHFEADQFFEADGLYCYVADKIKEAHAVCQANTRNALLEGKPVVVSNTFMKLWEMEPYHEMAREAGVPVRVIEATGNWPNLHGVPAEKVEFMRQRFERMVVPHKQNIRSGY